MALLTEHADQDALGGDRFRQTIHVKRIAFRRDGNLRRITNVLANTGDPALPVGVAELAQFRVADRLAGQSPVIHFGKGASNVRLTPLGTNNVAAVVAGNVVTYPGAWDNADLRYSIGGHILRKEIVLRAGHPSAFSFRIANHAGLNIDTLSTPDFRILQPSLDGPDGQHIPLVWGVSSSGGKYILTCTLPPGDYAGWVVDPTLVLQPDATDGQDTTVDYNSPDFGGYGTSSILYLNVVSSGIACDTMLKFALAPLPAAAIISTCTFSVRNGAVKVLDTVTLVHRILSANSGWSESSTWNYAVPSTTRWAGDVGSNGGADAGCSQSGLDYAAATLGALTVAANDPVGTQYDVALSVAEINLMVANNVGLVIITSAGLTDQCIYSSDDVTPANRPKLTIEYTLPAAGMSRAPIASWCH